MFLTKKKRKSQRLTLREDCGSYLETKINLTDTNYSEYMGDVLATHLQRPAIMVGSYAYFMQNMCILFSFKAHSHQR